MEDPARKAGWYFVVSTFSVTLLAELLVGLIMRDKKSLLGAEAMWCAAEVVGLGCRTCSFWSEIRDFWRLRVCARSVDREVLFIEAEEGGLRGAASAGAPPILATQLAVGAEAVPLSSTGFVAPFASGFGIGLCTMVAFDFGATPRIGSWGFVGGFDAMGFVLGFAMLSLDAVLECAGALRVGDGRGEGTFEREVGGTLKFLGTVALAGFEVGAGFVCILLEDASGFEGTSFLIGSFLAGSFLGATFLPCSFVAGFASAFVTFGGTFSEGVSTAGSSFAISAVASSPGAGSSVFCSSTCAGASSCFLTGSEVSWGFVSLTRAGPNGEPRVFESPAAGDEGETGSFCNPIPVPSFELTATNEVRTRPKGFGAGLMSRLTGGVLGDGGADDDAAAPFSNIARRFLTPPPLRGGTATRPDGSGEAIATGWWCCFGVNPCPVVRRSKRLMMSKMPEELLVVTRVGVCEEMFVVLFRWGGLLW
jgi:hypothetical protein